MNYWLMKSEPQAFSIEDLAESRQQISHWDGVRNYQARNMMRDEMRQGDHAFFYHSNASPPGIVGIMEIVKEGYPDFTAFNPKDKHYDPKSNAEKPTWFMVDVRFVEKFKQMITLEQLKANPQLAHMRLLQKGNRLSVMPVSHAEWRAILAMEK